MSGKFTREYLRELQSYPLEVKVQLTKQRIREWVNRWGEDGVSVSFSGGKDSTVLLHIVRKMYPNVSAVFFDTGLEFPEIREFVRTFDNVEWFKPKMNFRQVIDKYGYPFISKEVAQQVWEIQRYGKEKATWAWARFDPNSEQSKKYDGAYSIERYKFMISEGAPKFSHRCCFVMKKYPSKHYERLTGKKAIIATLTEESRLRESSWLKYGCNAFDSKRPTSKPMSFWTEQDVLMYIYRNKLPIASVYGEVVKKNEVEGQLDFEDIGEFSIENPELKTTGRKRTGCMFCGFGCHREPDGEGRFEQLKITHPKIYDYIMRPWDEGGLDYKNVIDWLNENGNLNIKY